MLAKNTSNEWFEPNQERNICHWVADGKKFFSGFTATGTYSAEFRLYVKLPEEESDCWYVYKTSNANRTAYLADRAIRFPEGTLVELRVIHDSDVAESFVGTILGGDY
ncbi:MAG: hypothetical protein N2043_01955 [Ignavibacterium sp.]|nr:hypothetical protein [Ignavibacterium sp.]